MIPFHDNLNPLHIKLDLMVPLLVKAVYAKDAVTLAKCQQNLAGKKGQILE